MSDLRDLYQELILDHGRRPRNFKELENPSCSADGHNPLCGDRLQVRVRCEGERIVDIGFQGAGCAICMASASTMGEAVKGHTRTEARELFHHFIGLVVEGRKEEIELLPAKLKAFSGVAEFPVRVKCATLAWHTLDAAMDGRLRASSEDA
jgi:nitrogen fixation NifU-like protein